MRDLKENQSGEIIGYPVASDLREHYLNYGMI